MRNLHELPEAELACVCDASEKALDAIALRYPAVPARPTSTTSSRTTRSTPSLLATPVSTHYTLGMRALEAGKHLFVEKPLAASSEEATELIEAADERGLMLMPGHTFLYSPPVDAVRNLITSGELGEIYFVSTSRVNLGLHQTDVSVAWDLGPHDFSILRYWLEEAPTNVTAHGARLRDARQPGRRVHQPPVPSGTIAQRRDLVARAEQAAPDDGRRLAEDGRLRRHEQRARARLRQRRQPAEPGVVRRVPADVPDGRHRLAAHRGLGAALPGAPGLRDARSGTAATPRSSAQLGLDVVRTIEAVDESLQHDGARVAI